jgi:nucleotide-sensitive chloride channel 1A
MFGFSPTTADTYSYDVVDSALTFIPSSGGQGFQVPYPAITLHAVSRSESGPSIYCQLDDSYTPHGVNGSNADDDDDEAGEIHELVIIPTDDSTRKSLFSIVLINSYSYPKENSLTCKL